MGFEDGVGTSKASYLIDIHLRLHICQLSIYYLVLIVLYNITVYNIPQVSRFRRLAQRANGAKKRRTAELKLALVGKVESLLH